MINHVWGLLHHPDREWREINREHESVSHMYAHHVLIMAAIPVVSSFIGTTQVGWTLNGEEGVKLSLMTALGLGVLFYGLILLAVAGVGSAIHALSRQYSHRPSRAESIVFAGYIATPMFLSGLFAIYPIAWLCVLAVCLGVVYSGYLLYKGTPRFLGISHKEGFILSTGTLGIGVLILEFLLAVVVLLWSMGSEHSPLWAFFG
ncbi:Yip1 family protein [Marinomonas gallaica]|uniref:Yip1 family protein n=1 Tax=Marinomonas gallaica TaxID=1806667 RepID=UPI0009EE17D0|nr:Yip1 family protein [Marinomonas gallaica]